ncbi:hypothetical protein DL762_000267 [Monosporascus cannonballus]|uniref:Membrane insertase YidC/Oxa/ALB C-terminal domain-containing protein n=1 Tax=Monosporascus cannonballus TaxID=155416 RepID=A0ABY0HKA3_9PEZI|nr:hypothetical protein DL763_008292 [Monosporascus cannonballus]RYO95074.1 hypothetical protein DL762_000267 [Monosporascus cannonballus]
MLPKRGVPSRINPAFALRQGSKVLRPSARQFSRLSSQGTNAPLAGLESSSLPRLASIGACGPSIISLRPCVVGGASTVFASRAGASRNLSLWPFGSKQQQSPGETPAATAETSPEPEPSAAATTISPDASSPAAQPVSQPVSQDATASASSHSADPFAQSATPIDPSLDNLDLTPSILDIPERIGYLKELGLEFGPGPTAACEWLLEHVYVYTGLPWWGALATAATLWRVILFLPTLRASKSSALMQEMQKSPEYLQASEEFKLAAYRTHDNMAMMKARARMTAIRKQAGVSFWWLPVPLLTVPFSFGMFRLVRGMASIPVPSMETGGFAWFTDLTIHDPYYILPIANVLLGTLMFKQNQKANLNPNPTQAAMMKSMIYIFPPLIFVSTAWLPAGLQWFFLMLSATTVAQTTATLNPAIRRWADLPPLPSSAGPVPGAGAVTYQAPTVRSAKNGEKGEKGGIIKDITKGVQNTLGQDDRKKAWEKAEEYEARRAVEEKEKEFRRLEEMRRKRKKGQV